MYREKTWIYGNRIEKRKYHCREYPGKGMKRAPREKLTPEKMQEQNERQAIRKMKRLMINNFTEDDWHVILTWPDETRPDPEEEKGIMQRFLRRLRAYYRKMTAELKYMMVTEWEKQKLNHHVVLNNVEKIGSIIRKLWPGGVFFVPLYEDRNFEGLAAYMVKESRETYRKEGTPWRQRYTCSRNLKKPEVHVRTVKADSWREEPKLPDSLRLKGYVLDKQSVVTGFDNAGYPFQEYCFVKYRD